MIDGRDADALILDRELCPAVAAGRREGHGFAGAILEGVRQQVGHYLLEPGPVPLADHGTFQLEVDLRPCPVELTVLLEVRDDFPDERRGVEELGLQLQLPPDDARDVEELGDQPVEPVALAANRLQARREPGPLLLPGVLLHLLLERVDLKLSSLHLPPVVSDCFLETESPLTGARRFPWHVGVTLARPTAQHEVFRSSR
ncbi:hypothetical protein [Hyalangium versicolor]|uniref:hypothetical protein n=1 Tax=Hyalangium versicolor TaxID=2861190 RepID=UPI002815FE32|nr:hypothetical protein [Hyalangium versicolor]